MGQPAKVYMAAGGSKLVVASGGSIEVEGGGSFDLSNGTGSISFTAGEITANDIADDSITAGKINETVIQQETVTLANSEIKALRATPYTLVAAPGAGKFIEFISAVMILDYGSEVLTESTDNMAIEYDDGSGSAVTGTIESTGFIDQSADTIKTVIAAEIAADAAADMVNKNLVLVNNGDGEFGGNASNDTTMKVITTYRVHTTGL